VSSKGSDVAAPGAGVAEMRLYAELNDYLPSGARYAVLSVPLSGEATVATLLQGAGVPRAEVDLILKNGEPAGFDDRVAGGDRLSIYPVFEAFDIRSVQRLRDEPLRTPAFVLDVHLGKLASFLRMLGFDALYSPSYTDEQLIAISLRERRTLLTRDRALLRNPRLERAAAVRADDPRAQIQEVVVRFHLDALARPLTRCLLCNTLLVPVDKSDILDRIPPLVRENQERFTTCPQCRRLFWEGTHHRRMMLFIASIIPPPMRQGTP